MSNHFYKLVHFETIKTLLFITIREINSANLVFHYFDLYS